MTPDSESIGNGSHSNERQAPLQFGVSTLLIITVIISAVARYLSPQGEQGFIIVAVTLPISFLIGCVLGRFWGAPKLRVYWAVIGTTIFQIISANVYMLRTWDFYVWPIFGGLVASSICRPNEYPPNVLRKWKYNSVIRMALGGFLGAIFYLVYSLALLATPSDLKWFSFEFAAFTGCGFFLGVLIECCIGIDKKFNISQLYVAFALVVSAILFATVAESFIPGW